MKHKWWVNAEYSTLYTRTSIQWIPHKPANGCCTNILKRQYKTVAITFGTNGTEHGLWLYVAMTSLDDRSTQTHTCIWSVAPARRCWSWAWAAHGGGRRCGARRTTSTGSCTSGSSPCWSQSSSPCFHSVQRHTNPSVNKRPRKLTTNGSPAVTKYYKAQHKTCIVANKI